MILSFAGFWLILPPWLFFKFFRRRFPEWQYLHELKVEIHGIKKTAKDVNFLTVCVRVKTWSKPVTPRS